MENQNLSDMVIYNDGEIELNVSFDSNTIWITQKQLSELFEVTIPNINMHIKTIYKENELNKSSTIKKFLTVQKEGNIYSKRGL